MTKPEGAGGPGKKEDIDSVLDLVSLLISGVSRKDLVDILTKSISQKKDVDYQKLLDSLDESKQKLNDKKELIELLRNTLATKQPKPQEKHSTRISSDKARVAEQISVPLEIFSRTLSSLEALVKYLRENKQLNLNEIARRLNRDSTTIWTTYNRAKIKQGEKFFVGKGGRLLPLAMFADRRLSVFEWVAYHLHQEGLRYSEIANLLNRDQRNIWSTVNRAKKKIDKKGVKQTNG